MSKKRLASMTTSTASFIVLTPSCSRRSLPCFADAAHGELAYLLAVVAQVVCGPDHLVQDDARPRRRGLPLVPRRPGQPELHRPSRQEQRELRKTVDLQPLHNG